MNACVPGAWPRPGPIAMTSRARSEQPIDAVGIQPVVGLVEAVRHVLGRHAPRRSAWQDAGVATVTRPAPDRSAPIAGQMRGAGLAARSGDDEDVAVVALVAVRRSRREVLARGRRASAARSAGRRANRSPRPECRCRRSRCRRRASRPAAARAAASARRASPSSRPRSTRRSARRSRPTGRTAGRSTTTGMPDALTSAITLSIRPLSGAFRPVPKIASTMSVQSRTSEKCSSHAWLSAISTTVTPRWPRISRLIRASPRTSATRPMRNTETSTPRWTQRARDDEAVAAVVAAAAQHGDLPLEQVGVDRLHRRHHLPAGVFHQDERRECRCPRSSGDRLRASGRRSGRASGTDPSLFVSRTDTSHADHEDTKSVVQENLRTRAFVMSGVE